MAKYVATSKLPVMQIEIKHMQKLILRWRAESEFIDDCDAASAMLHNCADDLEDLLKSYAKLNL